MSRLLRRLPILLILLALALSARAEVKMPAIFGNGMVLQRGIKAPLWGTAAPGEKIAITFAGQKLAVEAGADGAWKTALEPLSASTRSRTMTVKGTNTLTFEDVLVGDVWVCSGQSNMQWSAGGGLVDKEKEIKAAKYPQIRMISVPRVTSKEPLADFKAKWEACTPQVMQGFSAVGYFFGRDLHKQLNVPVGLIGTYWGGTPAQAWTSREALAADAQLKGYFDRWSAYEAAYPAAKVRFDAAMEAWKKLPAAQKAGKRAPRLDEPDTSPNRPANLYNAMIAPLIPFAIKGAIWYQGESNAGNPDEAALYHKLFSTMITDWRTRWGQGDFPFLFVQLANFMDRKEQPAESSWALLRESQLKTLALPATGMAVIIDAGEAKDIHPKNKQVVGQRLMLAALKVAYNRKDTVYSGPVFHGMAVQDDRIVLEFDNVGGGLTTRPEGPLKGFAIAGSDRKFVWADAKIAGNKIEVSSPEVKAPVAVRYAWADNPEANLYNKEGLPATPFRSDTWAPATAQPGPAAQPKAGKAKKAATLKPVKK